MSLAENHVSSCYPLGGTSRRRRLLAIRNASRNQSDSRVPESIGAAVCVPQTTPPRTGTIDTPDPVDDSPADVRPRRPVLTWMFLGESFLPPECGIREWPGFVELFTMALRSRHPGVIDPVVDACTPAFHARDLCEGFRDRIGRCNPSVVFLLCGAGDPDDGMSALPGFEGLLLQFARRTSEAGIRLVLNTSPVPYFPDDHPNAASHLIYAEAVRSIAAELELPLADHRREWEECAIPPGTPGSWYDDVGRYPSARGHRRIASRLTSVATGPALSVPAVGVRSLAATWD